MVVANLEAGPTKEEKVNALAEGMRAAVREVLGEDKDLTLSSTTTPWTAWPLAG